MYAEIARNKHRSIAFVGLFFVVWLGLGVALGLLWKALSSSSVDSSAPSRHVGSGWTPVAVTVTACALVAIAGVLYSLTAGAGLVLRASGAKPAEGSEFTQLHNLVEALAIGEGIPNPRYT